MAGPRNGHLLVVATTPDYVEILRTGHPGEVVFLTAPELRAAAREPRPPESEELLADPAATEAAWRAVRGHAVRHGIRYAGVACFDCESMALASALAARLGIDYPSVRAIARCRDKHRSKRLWEAFGIPCPASRRIAKLSDLTDFLDRVAAPVVIKPISGAGSELVFRCADPAECGEAFAVLTDGLARRSGLAMYRPDAGGHAIALAEECIEGEEYSADFVVADGVFRVIRVARKHRMASGPFGAIQAYEIGPGMPAALAPARLGPLLGRAAAALGVRRAVCMADFILRGGEPVFLEMAPRPGGDCLPWLLRAACGIDTLGLTLDLARGVEPPAAFPLPDRPWVGLRFFASAPGRVLAIDASAVAAAPGVRSVRIVRAPGDLVRLPPEDYDSWLLGHAIHTPVPGESVAAANARLLGLLSIRMGEPQ